MRKFEHDRRNSEISSLEDKTLYFHTIHMHMYFTIIYQCPFCGHMWSLFIFK